MRWEHPCVNLLQREKKKKEKMIPFGCSEVSSSFLSFPTFGHHLAHGRAAGADHSLCESSTAHEHCITEIFSAKGELAQVGLTLLCPHQPAQNSPAPVRAIPA